MADPEVLIVGGGLAGLACARHLHQANVPFVLFEGSDRVGGRVRTDVVDGFQLDRGFQVLLTAYPETQRELDYDALDLRAFYDGALVRYNGRFHRVADPFRQPVDAAQTLVGPIGTLGDKLRVARQRRALMRESLPELFMRDETTTLDALHARWGFSDAIIDRFFRPFFGGIFFDRTLQASSRMFEFVFKMFAEGSVALPADGIEAIPRQMAASLPPESIHVNTRVQAVEGSTVRLDDGTTRSAPSVVIATEAPTANELLGRAVAPTGRQSATCLYYAATNSPLKTPALLLNGTNDGPINNLSVLSDVAPSYAPPNRSLVSVVVVGHEDTPDAVLQEQVRAQLARWFDASVALWTHLRTDRIAYALPDQSPPFLSPPRRPVRQGDHVYVCGDHTRTASLNGAIASGRTAARAVLQDTPAVVA